MYKPYSNEDTRSSVLAGITDPDAQAAWSRFFDCYAGFVYSVARMRGLPDDQADEIVQLVMVDLAVGKGISGYDREKGRFRPWLSRRVTWRISDYVRSRQARPDGVDVSMTELDGKNAGPDESAIEREWLAAAESEALRRLQAAVGEQNFKVFHASVIEGLETEDVCRLFHVSRDNLYQIRKRVKARFAEILGKVLKDFDEPNV